MATTGTRQALLLRGINVGKSGNKLAMPLLREIAAELGCTDPVTYLQSGNLVAGSDRPQLAADLRAAIAARTGLDIPVVARTAEDLHAVIAANPLGEPADASRLFVSFCEQPVGDALDGLDPSAYAPETFAVVGSEIYSWLPGGMNGARLTGGLFERRTRGVVTVRNWRTVLALSELLDRPE